MLLYTIGTCSITSVVSCFRYTYGKLGSGGGVIPVYSWIGKLSYSFMLETFVFISGYIYGYQSRIKGLSPSITNEIIRKAKRLLLPSIIFGFIYYMLLDDLNKPTCQIVWNIIQGEAHLWFLPMLFWCFLFTIIFEKINLRGEIVIPLFVLIKICNVVPLPLRLWECLFYLPYFYVGYYIQKNDRMTSFLEFYSKYKLILLLTFFLLIFFSATELLEYVGDKAGKSMIMVLSRIIIRNYLMLTYSSLGILLCYTLANGLVRRFCGIPSWGVVLGSWCFGIYIYQQFILKLIYYHSPLNSVNPIIVPWIGFVVTLVLSILMTFLTLRFKIGRQLIG